MLPFPTPLRLLLAAQPELVTRVLQAMQRMVTRHQLHAAELRGAEQFEDNAAEIL
jgi:hypothetical protein